MFHSLPLCQKKSHPAPWLNNTLHDLHSAYFPGSPSSLPCDPAVERNCYPFTSWFRPMDGCSSSSLDCSLPKASPHQVNNYSTEASVPAALCLRSTFRLPDCIPVYRTVYNTNFIIWINWASSQMRPGESDWAADSQADWGGGMRRPRSPATCCGVSLSIRVTPPYKPQLLQVSSSSLRKTCSSCSFNMLHIYIVGFDFGTQNRPLSLPHQSLLWRP